MPVSTRTVAGLSVAHLVTDLYGPALPAIISLLILRFGYSYLAAGLLVTVYNAVSSLAQPGIGWIHDRKGLQLPPSLSILVCGLFISLLGVAPGFGVMLLFCGIAALGHAAFHPVALSLTGRESTDVNRGRVLSYFVVGGNLGFALGPLAAGAAIEVLGQGGILLMFLPALAIAMALLVLLPPRPPRPVEAVTGTMPGIPPAVWKPVAILVAGASLRGMVIFGSIAYLPIFLAGQGFDLLTANTLLTLTLLAGVGGQVLGGAVSDRSGRKETILAGMAATALFLAGFLLLPGLIGLACLMLFGFFLWSSFSVTLAIAHELLPGNLGLASGLLLGLSMGFGGLGVALIGEIGDTVGLAGAFWALFLITVLAIPLFIILPYPWRGRKTPSGEG
ncbi:MAG: MFS transporter [Methanomicrobiales archaeon]|jgi:FSR family fosmidomycin resistance protein-like MFS transporter